MKISIIGSGNVATHLGRALYNAGHEIAEVYSRSLAHAAELAGSINARPVTDPAALSGNIDVCLIAVKDDVIGKIAEHLGFGETAVVHTAGSIPMDLLEGSSLNYGVFYPFQTFSKSSKVNLSEAAFCIEGINEKTVELLEQLVKSIGAAPYRMNSEQRKVLHLAGVFASNFSNHLYVLAEQLLAEKQLSFDMLRPLIKETAGKVMEVSPFIAQTGPASRNDQKVITGHLEILEDKPELRVIYSLLSESIRDLHNK